MIHTGDCVTVMATLPDDSVDAVVTDPPYNLAFMGKAWDSIGRNDLGGVRGHEQGYGPRTSNPTCRTCGGLQSLVSEGSGGRHKCRCETPIFPNWAARDGGRFQAWCEAWGREALRVTKPGGYLLAFGGTRTHHRLVCGLEDAGWIIRDELDWIYASGFPKGKANLKPAHEPIVLARKPGPLRPLNIEDTRIGYTSEADRPTQEEWNRAGSSGQPGANGYAGQFSKGMKNAYAEGKILVPSGRWPSNLLLSDPELFDEPNPYVVGSGATTTVPGPYANGSEQSASEGWGGIGNQGAGYVSLHHGDAGGYSRFFIVPKADRGDREPILRGQIGTEQELPFDDFNRNVGNTLGQRRENSHPTVKPTDLMRHLVRLVTPSGGTVLDPFLGSGSTAIACELEGFPWIGIEREPEYVAIAEARLNGTQRGLGLDVPLVGEPRKSVDGVAGKRSGQNGYDGGWGAREEPWGGYGPTRPPKVDPEQEPGMFDEELLDQKGET